MRNVGDNGDARWEFEVKVLLEKLVENRTAHVEEYKQALVGYRNKLKEVLESKLKKLAETGDCETYISLPKPESHEGDYDRIIDVLQMTTAEYVNLTLSEFDKYVRDKWVWTENFKMSNSQYVGALK